MHLHNNYKIADIRSQDTCSEQEGGGGGGGLMIQ